MKIKKEYLNRNDDNESVYPENIVTNQLKNSWWTSGSSGWITNSGSVEFDEDDAGFMNLTVDSTGSSQVKQLVALKPGHRYFVMLEVKVTRYVKGSFGIHVNGKTQSGPPSFGLQRLSKNKKYETIVGTFTTEGDQMRNYAVFVGSIGSANGAGKIRKLSLYNLTELYGLGNEPTAQEFLSSMPENQNEFGIRASMSQIYASLDTKVNHLRKIRICASDEEAHQVFIKEMNKKAASLDMNRTVFKNVQGFKMTGHLSTTRDFLKLGLHVMGHDELLKIWGVKQYSVEIKGENVRQEAISTTLKDSFLEENYELLGGKTGQIGNSILSVLTLVTDKEGTLYLAVVMGASGLTGETDRFEAVHQLISNSQNEMSDLSEQSFKATAGSILKIPDGNPLYYTNATPPSTFSINEEELNIPASLTKLMTALLVVENSSNLNEMVTVISSDISGGSGPEIYEGDQLSIKDALYLLLLSSSNTAAKLLSRIIGHKIIQARGYIK